MWEYWVKTEQYSIAYFDHATSTKALGTGASAYLGQLVLDNAANLSLLQKCL